MNQSTGPPREMNMEDLVTGIALVGFLALLIIPFAYVTDELDPSLPIRDYKYLK